MVTRLLSADSLTSCSLLVAHGLGSETVIERQIGRGSATLLRSQRGLQNLQVELSDSTPRPLVRQFTNDVRPCVVFANSRSILTVSPLYIVVA